MKRQDIIFFSQSRKTLCRNIKNLVTQGFYLIVKL